MYYKNLIKTLGLVIIYLLFELRWHPVSHVLPLSSAPTGLSQPQFYPVNETAIQLDWDPPAQLNGPHPLYQVCKSIDFHTVYASMALFILFKFIWRSFDFAWICQNSKTVPILYFVYEWIHSHQPQVCFVFIAS